MFGASIHVSEAASSFRRAGDRFATEVMHALERTAQLATTYAKTSALYKSHTYGLRSSITFGTQLGSRSAHAVMRASAPYAEFVENGSKPHTIEAKRKSTLRFVQNGAVRFARVVRHPGTKATHFMVKAQERATPLLERLMAEAVTKALGT